MRLTLLILIFALGASAQTNNYGVRVTTNAVLLTPTGQKFFTANGAALQSYVNPATNTPAGIAAATGGIYATNTYVGISNALGGFPPATNTYAGISAALGNFQPATNSYAGISAALGNFAPATNTSAGIVTALGYGPTQLGGTNTWTGTNSFSLGVGSTYSNAATIPTLSAGSGNTGNGFLWTNNFPGMAQVWVTPTNATVVAVVQYNGALISNVSTLLFLVQRGEYLAITNAKNYYVKPF